MDGRSEWKKSITMTSWVWFGGLTLLWFDLTLSTSNVKPWQTSITLGRNLFFLHRWLALYSYCALLRSFPQWGEFSEGWVLAVTSYLLKHSGAKIAAWVLQGSFQGSCSFCRVNADAYTYYLNVNSKSSDVDPLMFTAVFVYTKPPQTIFFNFSIQSPFQVNLNYSVLSGLCIIYKKNVVHVNFLLALWSLQRIKVPPLSAINYCFPVMLNQAFTCKKKYGEC